MHPVSALAFFGMANLVIMAIRSFQRLFCEYEAWQELSVGCLPVCREAYAHKACRPIQTHSLSVPTKDCR
jgi:hypothetical protein